MQWFPGLSAQIARLKGFYWGHSIPAEVQKAFATDGASKSNQQAFLSYFQNFRKSQEYFEPRTHELRLPVLVLWGKQDRFINVKLAYEIVDKLPDARLEVVDKAGHYIHMDKPREVARAVTRFLGEETDPRQPARQEQETASAVLT